MDENRQLFTPASTQQKSGNKLDPQKIAAILLGVFLCLTVVSVLGGIEKGIMVYQGLVVTAIAWLTYRYSKSAESIARASLKLYPGLSREEPFPMPLQGLEDKKLLTELLQELRKAETRPRPPFELSAWERNEERLRHRKTLREAEIAEAASCYEHLATENEEIGRWRELELRLDGLVDAEKRRTISLTLNAMENENLAVIHRATSMLERRLNPSREPRENLRQATTRREANATAQSRLAVSSFGRWG
jgi:hypothetical protein